MNTHIYICITIQPVLLSISVPRSEARFSLDFALQHRQKPGTRCNCNFVKPINHERHAANGTKP